MRQEGSLSLGVKALTDSPLLLDMLVEILYRLPEKSLRRFMCVSKQWCNLIHDGIQRRLPKTVTGLFHHDLVCIEKFFIDSDTPNTLFRLQEYRCNFVGPSQVCHDTAIHSFHPVREIFDCCNGLLLCRPGDNNLALSVCNPATRRWRMLPEVPKLYGFSYLFVLAFDPWVSPHYKVIRFVKPKPWESKGVVFNVFDSTKDEWSEPKPFPAAHIRDMRRGCFLGGILFLISSQHGVVRFDLSNGNCHAVRLPVHAIGQPDAIGVYPGSLCLATCDGFWLRAWILKDWGTGEWTLKHSTNLEALAKKYPQELHPLPTRGMLKLLAFHPYLEVVFLRIGFKVFSYDLNSLMLENPFNLEPGLLSSTLETFVRQLGVFPFSPCLIDLPEDADMGEST